MADLWINGLLPIKLFRMANALLVILLFAFPLSRKKHFAARIALWSAGCMLFAAALPILSESLWCVSSVFLLEYLAAMLLTRFCFNADWNTVLFVGAAGFSIDHTASMLDSLVSLANPAALRYMTAGRFTPLIWVNYITCRIIVYFLADLLVVRKNREIIGESISLISSVRIAVISLIVNLYLNLIFSGLVSDQSFWLSFFTYLMNILISVLLLICQFAFVRENRMKVRLQISDLLREQAREQYRISKENVEAINIKCHDLKHLLLESKALIAPEEYANMMEMIDSYGAEIKTNNEVLDVVFQEKNFQCRKQGIQFTCIIDGTAVNFMETTDLYVLFGNLIDNAIEAVQKLPQEEVRNIQVTVRRERGFVVITTENGYAGTLEWTDGRPGTSKEDKQNHGFGLLSIEKIVHKYGGRYSISTDDQIFCMSILFPSQKG